MSNKSMYHQSSLLDANGSLAAPADGAKSLPVWADLVRQKYLAGESSVFVLYGNVFDRVLYAGKAYGTVSFLSSVLLKENKQAIYEVSIDRGLSVLQGGSAEEKAVLFRELEGRGLGGIFESLERRMRARPANALIIPYAGTLVPAAESHMLSLEERGVLTSLHRWSLDDELLRHDNVIFLVTESLSEVNPALLSNPKVAAIELPLPDYEARLEAISFYAKEMDLRQKNYVAAQTAGLRIIQLASIVASEHHQGLDEQQRIALLAKLLQGTPQAEQRAAKLASITAGMTPEEICQLVDPQHVADTGASPDDEMFAVISKRKRELIEKQCSGLIEFMEPRVGLDAVGGNEHIKQELMEIARLIREGDRRRVPMGVLAVGPMGAGKTFVIKAFLKEAGLTGIALKNFRSKWVGSTEANLEKVLATVKAMGPIALIIDEGDRSFGSDASDSDGGVGSRVIARLKAFMSDTENRGQVLFILMTNRPDKLDTDIKRPGRLDKKIPFFYADSGEERASIIQAILSRYRVSVSVDSVRLSELCGQLSGYSNADLEAMALLAVDHALANPAKLANGDASTPVSLDEADLLWAIEDFLPPREEGMLQYMEMLAVFETSRRSLLPERFKNMSAEEIQNRLQQLRQKIMH